MTRPYSPRQKYLKDKCPISLDVTVSKEYSVAKICWMARAGNLGVGSVQILFLKALVHGF
jgi:hypothetical protein